MTAVHVVTALHRAAKAPDGVAVTNQEGFRELLNELAILFSDAEEL